MNKKLIIYIIFFLMGGLLFAQQNIGSQKGDTIISLELNIDNTVTFRLKSPKASSVAIRGDWMSTHEPAPMKKSGDGIWTYTTDVLSSDLYMYTFNVDGSQIIDPGNVFSLRDVNSLFSKFYINGGKGDYYQVHDSPHGNVTRTWYESKVLKMNRRMTIYTPPGYEANTESYPVLYLLHGSGGDEEAWITLGCVSRIMDNLIAEGKVEPMIVVMPNGNASKEAAPGETPENLSYTPMMSHELPGFTDGIYELSFHEIIHFIEKYYRVKSEKNTRAIAGLSMGGFHSLYISANNPELFDYIGLFSPAIKFPGIKSAIYNDLDTKLFLLKENEYELYWIGCGNKDFLFNDVKKYLNRLDSLGLSYTYDESTRGHIWSNWRAYLLEFAPLLFK
ncbi:MAG: esterase [Labilibaculum sp.]|nr:esterase [Labilibaculum sp.]